MIAWVGNMFSNEAFRAQIDKDFVKLKLFEVGMSEAIYKKY